MWLFKAPFLWLLVCTLAGCGFYPEYGQTEQRHLSEDLRYFSVDTMPGRLGQVLYNQIIDQIRPLSPARHQASLKLEVQTQPIGLSKDIITTRTEVSLAVHYQFYPQGSPHQAVQGTCHATTYYSTSGRQIYQSISTERDAHTRAVKQVGQCVLDRMALYLDRQYSSQTSQDKP